MYFIPLTRFHGVDELLQSFITGNNIYIYSLVPLCLVSYHMKNLNFHEEIFKKVWHEMGVVMQKQSLSPIPGTKIVGNQRYATSACCTFKHWNRIREIRLFLCVGFFFLLLSKDWLLMLIYLFFSAGFQVGGGICVNDVRQVFVGILFFYKNAAGIFSHWRDINVKDNNQPCGNMTIY